MNNHFTTTIKETTKAEAILESSTIQSLWSGYGEIKRIKLKNAESKSVVVKNICLPKKDAHPRGWNTDISHNRKVKSYEVEIEWYKQWSKMCDANCKVPKCLGIISEGDEILIILEDLNESGFSLRKHSVNISDIKLCLKWLAHFHATFMGNTHHNLWKTGTYWHLETRPDELEALTDINLKNVAYDIDLKLNNAQFQTLVHGDAKLANFCFSPQNDRVAAVDFQYVGNGCGMKDVAYLIGSCLNECECEKYEGLLLNSYFDDLRNAIKSKQKNLHFEDLESEWRYLFYYAWADFHRFLKGWSPGHWKINSYSEKICRNVISEIIV